MTTTEDIPPRFTEASFRRYEPFIHSAIAILPSALEIDPRGSLGLSPETVSARLRDAMRSLHTYRWTTSVDMVKFNEYYQALEVARKDNLVIVRLKEKRVVQTPHQLNTIELPLDCDEDNKRRAVEAALTLVHIAGATLGKAGLSGIRLKNIDQATVSSYALAGDTRVGMIEEPPDVILL